MAQRGADPDHLHRDSSPLKSPGLRALRLYEWNAAVSGAFFEILGHFEVILRNSLHEHLTAWHAATGRAGQWYDDPAQLLDASSQLSSFLEIDGSCQTAITDTGNSSKSPTYLTKGDNAYVVAPGSHQLAVVAFSGNPPSSCTGQTAAGTISASFDAGKRVEAVAFGSSPQGFHLLVLPVPGS